MPTYGGGLAGIDVADNDDVDVSLLLLTVGLLVSSLMRTVVAGRGANIPHFGGVGCES